MNQTIEKCTRRVSLRRRFELARAGDFAVGDLFASVFLVRAAADDERLPTAVYMRARSNRHDALAFCTSARFGVSRTVVVEMGCPGGGGVLG